MPYQAVHSHQLELSAQDLPFLFVGSFKGVLYALPSGCQGKQSCNLFSCNKIENNTLHFYGPILG